MTTSQIPALLAVLRAAHIAKVATLLWSPPGRGKSSLVRTLAAAEGLPCETVLASLSEPSDFAGLPVVTDSGVRFEPPAWAKRAAASDEGCWLLLDEVTTATPATQKVLLAVTLDRRVGDLSLPDSVRLIAAANPADCAADGWDLAPPLANRFLHLTFDPPAAAWIDGIVTGFPQPAPDPLTPLNAATRARAAAQVAGFIRHRPDLLDVMPVDPVAAGRAWPSRRTWGMLIDVMAQLTTQDAVDIATRGLVGEGAAGEFLTWLDHADLPDPEAMLEDPASIQWPERADQVWAAASGAVALASNGTKAAWAKGWAVLLSAADNGHASVAAACSRPLMNSRPAGARPPAAVARLRETWTMAGLMEAGD